MAVPMFKLVGTLVDISARPLQGIRVMAFTQPSMQFALDADLNDYVVIRSVVTTTDKNGYFELDLVTKEDLHYKVAPEHSAAFDAITFAAPAADTTVNLASLVDVVPSPIPATGAAQLRAEFEADLETKADLVTGTVPDDQLPERLSEADLSASTAAIVAQSVVTPPTGFALTSTVPYTIYRTTTGRYLIDIDVDSLKPPAGVTYYVAPAGTTGASGLTPAAPLKLATAINKSDVGTIICLPGEYFRNNHTAPKITKNLNVILQPGAILTGFEDPTILTWTLHSGSIYKTTRTVTVGVVDKRAAYVDANGDYPLYLQATSLAGVTGPGTWYTDGTTVYVWALGAANLVTDSSFMRLNLDASTTVLNMEGAFTLYIEGGQIEGGGSSTRGAVDVNVPTGSSDRPRLIMVDTVVKYSGGKGIKTTGAEFVLLIRPKAMTTGGDGISHHDATRSSVTFGSQVIEVDPYARNNGQSTNTSENDNCGTSHGVSRVIRLNFDFRGSYGPPVGEDSGAKSWNLGGVAGSSRAPTRFWAYCASTSGAEQWLEDCAADPGLTALHAYDATSKVHVRRGRTGSLMRMSKNSAATGVIDTY